MGLTGTSAQSDYTNAEKEEEAKRVSCIVKFRPCKDWRGEYGFDWVRGGEEDYEERIDLRDIDLTKKQKEQIIRKHMGEEKYRKWKRKLMLNILNGNTEEERTKASEQYDKAFDRYYNKLSEEEVNDNFDAKAWQSPQNRANDTFSESDSEMDQGPTPMEYAYPAKYVTRVVYEVNRKEYGNVWFTSCLEYEDMANGSVEIQDSSCPAFPLDCLVNIKGHIQSLYDKKNYAYYAIPYYWDGKTASMMPNSFAGCSLSDKHWFVQDKKNVLKTIRQVAFNEFLHGEKDSIVIGDLNFPQGITCKAVHFIKFADTDQPMDYNYKYIKIKGKLHTVASVACMFEGAARDCRCHYIDGKLDQIYCGGKWLSLVKAKKDKKYQEEAQSIETMAAKVFLDRMINNQNVDINYLIKQNANGDDGPIKDGVLDRIRLTVSRPLFLERCFLTAKDGFLTHDEKEFWENHEITSWKKRYEESFQPLDLILIDKDGKEEKVDYRIPKLSFGVSDFPRKRFTFRSCREAPQKVLEKTGEFKLQLRIEGDCPKLRFDTNNPNVSVDPKEISSPKDHDEITVKYSGSTPCGPSVFAICVDDQEKEKRVGQLDLLIEEKRTATIGLVHVLIDGKPLSSKFLDAIEDNVDLMNNALLQAGIEPCYIRSNIKIKSSSIKKYMSRNKLVYDKSNYLDKLLDKTLKEQHENNLELRFSYLIYCIDKGFDDSIAGYSSGTVDNLILISNSSAYDRGDISTLMHELLHALKHPHHFQLNLNNDEDSNAFCFPIQSSSNIMDYYTLNYSLHQYQWWLMQYALDGHNEDVVQEMEAERIRLKEKHAKDKKKQKQKRDREGRILI